LQSRRRNLIRLSNAEGEDVPGLGHELLETVIANDGRVIQLLGGPESFGLGLSILVRPALLEDALALSTPVFVLTRRQGLGACCPLGLLRGLTIVGVVIATEITSDAEAPVG
jgi:hypothetical protein